MNNLYISKESSTALKGIAIMIMLYLHCFLSSKWHPGIELIPLTSIFYHEGDYLLIHRFCVICVPLYMTISGYGLYIVSKNGKSNWERVGKLLFNVTVVGALFYPISYFFPHLGWYFGNGEFVKCITGYNPYNAEWWFIAPWILLCLASPIIIRLFKKNVTLASIAVFFLYCFGKYIAHTNMPAHYRSLQVLASTLICLFPFVLGIISARYSLFKIWDIKHRKLISSIAFILLFLMKVVFIKNGFIDPIIAGLSIICIIQLIDVSQNGTTITYSNSLGKTTRHVFFLLGCQSTNMWLIHTFICCYYFANFLYILKFPLLIYLVLIVVSYILAVLIQNVQNYLWNKLTS